MDARRTFRILSAALAAVSGGCAIGLYFLWTAGLLGPLENRESAPTLRFYLLYVVTLIFAGQALTGLPVWKLPDAWNALKGWQRGVIGIAIVVVAIVAHFAFVIALERRGLIDERAVP